MNGHKLVIRKFMKSFFCYSLRVTEIIIMMIITPNSRAHKGEKVRGELKGEHGGIGGLEEGNAVYIRIRAIRLENMMCVI